MIDFRNAASNATDGAKKIWSSIASTARNIKEVVSTSGAPAAKAWGPPTAGKKASGASNPIHQQHPMNRSTFVLEDEEDEDETMQVSL